MGLRGSLCLLAMIALALPACKRDSTPTKGGELSASSTGGNASSAGMVPGGGNLPEPRAANKADDNPLPKDGPGDPAITYELVNKNPGKYRGKRVTWSFTPLSADGKRMMCALDEKEAIGPSHAGIYVVQFASDREAGDTFIAMAFKPGSTITGTVAGQVDQFLVVKGPDGVTPKDIPKVTVPLILHPAYKAAEPARGKVIKGKG